MGLEAMWLQFEIAVCNDVGTTAQGREVSSTTQEETGRKVLGVKGWRGRVEGNKETIDSHAMEVVR